MPTSQTPAPAELAVSRFQQGFACSQAVFSSLVGRGEVSEDAALRIAAPFGGGISHTGQICGAVSGALMALGLSRGSDQPDPAAKEHTYALAQLLIARFRASHGSVLCRDLLGVDISTPEGLKRARDEKLTARVCPCYVRDAVESALTLLNFPAPGEPTPG